MLKTLIGVLVSLALLSGCMTHSHLTSGSAETKIYHYYPTHGAESGFYKNAGR